MCSDEAARCMLGGLHTTGQAERGVGGTRLGDNRAPTVGPRLSVVLAPVGQSRGAVVREDVWEECFSVKSCVVKLFHDQWPYI